MSPSLLNQTSSPPPPSSKVADKVVQRLLRDHKFYLQWLAATHNPDTWLVHQGYNTTQADVITSWFRQSNLPLKVFANTYGTLIDGKPGPELVVADNAVFWGAMRIEKSTFISNTLSWTQSQNNANAAILHFSLLTAEDGQTLPKGSYVGPQFYGTVTNDITSDVVGRVGGYADNPPAVPSTLPEKPPVNSIPLSQYNAKYSTDILSGKWGLTTDTLIVNAPTVTYQDKTLNNVSWDNGKLTVSTTDGNAWNISITFFGNNTGSPTDSSATFFGWRWAGGSMPDKQNFMGQIPTPGSNSATPASLDDLGNTLLLKMMEVNLFSIISNHYVIKGLSKLDNIVYRRFKKKDPQTGNKSTSTDQDSPSGNNQEQAGQEQTAQEQGPQEQAAQEQAAQEQAGQEQAAQEQAAQEQAAQEQAAQEQAAQEQAAQEQAAQEQAAQEQAVQEQAAQEQAAQEQAAQEQAAQEQAAQEEVADQQLVKDEAAEAEEGEESALMDGGDE